MWLFSVSFNDTDLPSLEMDEDSSASASASCAYACVRPFFKVTFISLHLQFDPIASVHNFAINFNWFLFCFAVFFSSPSSSSLLSFGR